MNAFLEINILQLLNVIFILIVIFFERKRVFKRALEKRKEEKT